MSHIPLEVLEHDPQVFDVVHMIAEERIAALGAAHVMIAQSLDRIELRLKSRAAIDLGIRAFEVVAGEELAREVRVVDILRYGVQAEKTGNFTLQFIEELYAAGERLPDTSPELVEACERLSHAHLDEPDVQTVLEAHAGAGMMNELFNDVILSTIVGDE